MNDLIGDNLTMCTATTIDRQPTTDNREWFVQLISQEEPEAIFDPFSFFNDPLEEVAIEY